MDFDLVIIGAGVIGLSVGKALLNRSDNICLIEKRNSYGLETSSRNSEVIHSGIYYPKDSLKIMCWVHNIDLKDEIRKNVESKFY